MACRPFGHYSLCVWAESTRLPCRANRINQVGISLEQNHPGNRFEADQLCYSPPVDF